jgi:hypothetical protein
MADNVRSKIAKIKRKKNATSSERRRVIGRRKLLRQAFDDGVRMAKDVIKKYESDLARIR